MRNITHENYSDLIAEARQLRDHLMEWTEQFPEYNHMQEAESCHSAVRLVISAMDELAIARNCNDADFNTNVEQALHNVETGQATRADAALLRRALA